MIITSAVLDTASEFYSEFKRKGLHFRKENGRDDELLKELARNIGCPDNNLQKFQKKSGISAKTFLIAFLKVAQPIAKMFEDIWRYLSQKAPPHSSESISFRFGLPGSTESTTIDLETFRRYADSFRYFSSKIKFSTWPEAELSQLFTLSKILEYPGLDEHRCLWLTLPAIKRVRDFHPIVLVMPGAHKKADLAFARSVL